MSLFDNLDDAIEGAFRYKKRANRLRKRVVLLKAKIAQLKDGAFAANEEAQIRNDRIEQLEGEKEHLEKRIKLLQANRNEFFERNKQLEGLLGKAEGEA